MRRGVVAVAVVLLAGCSGQGAATTLPTTTTVTASSTTGGVATTSTTTSTTTATGPAEIPAPEELADRLLSAGDLGDAWTAAGELLPPGMTGGVVPDGVGDQLPRLGVCPEAGAGAAAAAAAVTWQAFGYLQTPGASLSLHHLRHPAAALMIREGVHMELVRDQLGHSSTEVTQP
jgi:hypothetical protein